MVEAVTSCSDDRTPHVNVTTKSAPLCSLIRVRVKIRTDTMLQRVQGMRQ